MRIYKIININNSYEKHRLKTDWLITTVIMAIMGDCLAISKDNNFSFYGNQLPTGS